MPAAICGEAAGSTSRRMLSRRGILYERAVSSIVGSIERTPSIVFSRIGKRQKNAMNATFCRLPIECTRMIEIGSSAGGGIARQNSICGIVHSRAQRDSPIGMPRPMPTITAIRRPRPMRSRLGTTCSPN